MSRFPKGLIIPKYFGDFGGDYSERDTVAPFKKTRAEHMERLLPSDAFAKKLSECLNVVLPSGLPHISKYDLTDGRQLFVAPALSRYYILAGYLALSLLDGWKKAVLGTYSKEAALIFASSCKALGLQAKLCLSRELGANEALVAQLRKVGCELDLDSCRALFDTPYCYVNFDDAAGYSIIPIEANYGPYPQAALTGLLASLYGQDLLSTLGEHKPDAVVVKIKTGTEAVGVMSPLLDSDIRLATVEETVSKEFHLEDSGCYTLSTRSADNDEPDTTICPQVAYWWRMAKVLRLGCDRIFPVNTEKFDALPLSQASIRAASLAYESLNCSDILLLEEC